MLLDTVALLLAPLLFSLEAERTKRQEQNGICPSPNPSLPELMPSSMLTPFFFSPPLSLLLPLASWVPTFPYTHGTETALRAFSGREHLGKIIEALVYPSHTLVLAKLAKKWRDMPEQGLKTW